MDIMSHVLDDVINLERYVPKRLDDSVDLSKIKINFICSCTEHKSVVI